MDIQGGYAKPKVTDVLWIQLVLLPITLCRWAYFYARLIITFITVIEMFTTVTYLSLCQVKNY